MKSAKKTAAIHDISGIGKCSLTAIIPVMSAMGIQVCPVPTAVLSAHTGYSSFVMKDLTDFIGKALENYKTLGTSFDCIYSGFLASADQIEHCADFFDAYPGALKVVDPVMGDNGKRYKTITDELCTKIKMLVKKADLITPNLTEAALLLDEDCPVNGLRANELKSWLVRLSQLSENTRYIVITGAQTSDGKIWSAGYDRTTGGFWRVGSSYVPMQYSGCGDLFTAVLVGGLMSEDSLPIALDRAAHFTGLAIKTTYSYGISKNDGILFEPQLAWLNNYSELGNFEPI